MNIINTKENNIKDTYKLTIEKNKLIFISRQLYNNKQFEVDITKKEIQFNKLHAIKEDLNNIYKILKKISYDIVKSNVTIETY